MWSHEGDDVGSEVVGLTVGLMVGLTVGLTLGDTVGLTVGDKVGMTVGDMVGLTAGLMVGLAVGLAGARNNVRGAYAGVSTGRRSERFYD